MWTRGWGKLGGLAYIHLCQHCLSLSRVLLFVTPWTVAHQAPLSMGFPRQEYWSALPFPTLRDLPNPGIKAGSPALQADSLPSEPPGKSAYTHCVHAKSAVLYLTRTLWTVAHPCSVSMSSSRGSSWPRDQTLLSLCLIGTWVLYH